LKPVTGKGEAKQPGEPGASALSANKLILLGEAALTDKVVEYITRSRGKHTIVVDKAIAHIAGRKLYERLNADKYELIVFEHRNPEENALKIWVHSAPEVIIDCDPRSTLHFLKKILEAIAIEKINCDEV